MTSVAAARDSRVQNPPLPRALIAFGLGVMLFVFLIFATVTGYQVAYAGVIFPGVSINGVDLSGLTPDQAGSLLNQRLDYPQNGRIVLQDRDQIWQITPSELGLQLDAYNSAQAAYTVGRGGDLLSNLFAQFNAWYSGADYPPLMLYDERVAEAYLTTIANQVNRPTIEATINLSGLEITTQPGQIGRALNVPETLHLLENQVQSFSDGMIPLEIVDTPPAIMDASPAAELARSILSEPLNLTLPSPGEGDPASWTFSQDQIAALLSFSVNQDQEYANFEVSLSPQQLRQFLEGIAPQLARNPNNARFIFNDDTRELEVIRSAVIGRYLDIEKSIQSINQGLLAGKHSIPLEVAAVQPAVGNVATAASLGITELVSVSSSFFRGSSGSRIQNIQTAAAEFHGLLVPPWTTFSMAENMREVSLDNGYAEALIIYGGRTIEGVGGGVCQVSTTLFRTAFFGGYPIDERYSHAYRVGYYEQTSNGIDPSLAGLDATVYVPVVDLKFTNNTPNWLLMETYVNPSNGKLTWKFYSTSDNRSVEWNTTGPRNVVEPPKPRYEENPDLARGQIKQVDWEAEGADITVTRTVYKDGVVLFEDIFSTHYEPWQAVYQYGPGTKIPKGNN